MSDVLLQVTNLTKYFPVKDQVFRKSSAVVHALEKVSLSLNRQEVMGIVGESGCGKSTLARVILRLLEPTSGEIVFDGINITNLKKQQMREIRKNMQIVFQDPYSSLNPRKKVGDIIAEPLDIHQVGTRYERQHRVHELLEIVGLSPNHASRYPHEFSGGQRQRIGIARALALNPRLVICDEPVSALDVSVQAQIINLLEDLKDQFGLSYIFIAHGLQVVRHISDRIAVMYLGQIVELGNVDDIFSNPKHPYTRTLISAIPTIDFDESQQPVQISGEIPSPINPPQGCRFHTRCPVAMEKCKVTPPDLRLMPDGRSVACHVVSSNS